MMNGWENSRKMLESEEMKTKKLKNVEISSKYLVSVQICTNFVDFPILIREFGNRQNQRFPNYLK